MSANKFDRPDPSWVPLAMGPFRYRRIAGFDLDEYQDGTSDVDLCRWAETNGGGHFEFEWCGAICFIAGMALFTFYPDQLERGLQADDLQEGGGDQQTCEAWAKGINALWKRMTQEFRCAVAANVCRGYGRVGTPTAADQHYAEIPNHMFDGCQIMRWGSPELGGSHIKLEDGASLYDVHLCSNGADPLPVKRGRRPKLDWEGRIKTFIFEQMAFHGALSECDPEWSCQADVERAVIKFIEDDIGTTASEERVRTYTRKFMLEWQQQKDGN
jgi:hypothetical protein